MVDLDRADLNPHLVGAWTGSIGAPPGPSLEPRNGGPRPRGPQPAFGRRLDGQHRRATRAQSGAAQWWTSTARTSTRIWSALGRAASARHPGPVWSRAMVDLDRADLNPHLVGAWT